jgi:hypothetical protein
MCVGILVSNLIQMRSGQFPFVLTCSQTKGHDSHALVLNAYKSVVILDTITHLSVESGYWRWNSDYDLGRTP